MAFRHFPVRHIHNANADPSRAYGSEQAEVVNLEASAETRSEISSWPGYRATPLCDLKGLAAELQVGRILYKDEARRFGLKSFKALGGAYAVLKVIAHILSQRHGIAGVTAGDLIAGKYRDAVKDIAFAAATDGNHGRSVAWGAQMFGAQCHIFLHA